MGFNIRFTFIETLEVIHSSNNRFMVEIVRNIYIPNGWGVFESVFFFGKTRTKRKKNTYRQHTHRERVKIVMIKLT